MAELMRLLGIMRPIESEPHPWAMGQAETAPEEGNLSGLWLGRGDGESEGGEGSQVGGNEDVPDDQESEVVDVAPEERIKNSVGFKMLGRMGWKEGKGIGLRGDGRLDPVFACNKDEYGEKGAGLRHLSEALMLQGKNRKRPQDMESWEREEKTEDWLKGSKSSLWLPAGLLEDQDKNFASSVNSAASTHISTYWDAWEDKQRSVLVNTRGDTGVADEIEGDWEDQWEMSVGRDLEGDSLNSDLFFSCIVVLGSRIKLLQVEPTGEVFQHTLWAHNSRSLRSALESKLQSGLRVLRPLIKQRDDKEHLIYGILAKGGEGQMNREAERVQGLRLYGPMWLVSRVGGRHVRDYLLLDYEKDFVRQDVG